MSDNNTIENNPQNFITSIVENDLSNGTHKNRLNKQNQPLPEIITRFPPEPNGYLHIGHAKSIFLNFGLAQRYKGRCHLRFDDTNPEKESQEFVDDIQNAVEWLGFWDKNNTENLYYASDYFDTLYEFAEVLIKKGLAYVDSQTSEQIKFNRGTLQHGGIDSPYRNRKAEENLQIFQGMKAGKYTEGTHVLRAKIDMESPNINMRDPIIYRIKYAHHHRSGDKWCIYPMYDYTHCISDALENITHSICTLEFEDHRPLYNWILEHLKEAGVLPQILPKQYEFARLNLHYALTSKRKILQLIQNNVVDGWDDPRLATLAGIRRRGYSPASIRLFCERIGVAKADSWIDYATLEQALRDDLDPIVPRLTTVLKPLKLIIDNMADDHVEWCNATVNPHNAEQGKRNFTLSKELWIEQDDFMLEPSKGFYRLFVGNKVRLRYGFVVECTGYDVDSENNVIAVHVNYFADSKSGTEGSNNYKVKGNIHWVDAKNSLAIQVNLYEHLFTDPQPDASGKNFLELINSNSKNVVKAYLENSDTSNSIANEMQVQFERHGYFVKDIASNDEAIIFNRITLLKDSKHKA
jgi:glutaminyl-tRNA synthetase